MREDNARLRFLSAEEESCLRECVLANWPHHLPELQLSLNTGVRLSEQYHLKWEDVDFERKLITLLRTKNGRARHIPLNREAVAALRAAETQKNTSPYVFLNHRGERLATSRFWFDAAIAETKLAGVTWHTLRHTFASRLAMAGVPLRTIQDLLGHTTMAMTIRYAHLSPQHVQSAVDRLCETDIATDPKTDTGSEVTLTIPTTMVQ